MSDIEILQAASAILYRHNQAGAAAACATVIGRIAVDTALGGHNDAQPAPGNRLTRLTEGARP